MAKSRLVVQTTVAFHWATVMNQNPQQENAIDRSFRQQRHDNAIGCRDL